MERHSIVCLDDEEMSSPEVSSTEVKNMKQARLPFSPFEMQRQKKRRSSVRDKNPKSAKIVKKETKKMGITDINDEEKMDKKQVGKVSVNAKEEKENIKFSEVNQSSREAGTSNSPICKKYEADSSCNDNTPPNNNKSSKESTKKRKKRVSNNSPSIVSLFKKITDKKLVEVVQLSDEDEPLKKKIKNDDTKLDNSCALNSSSDQIDMSKFLEVSIVNDSPGKADIETSSLSEEKPASNTTTPKQKSNSAIKTPKQLEREKQRILKQEEREHVKAEKEKAKLEQKLQREKEQQSKKEEIQKVKDEKMKKKQEENETKNKEKEEKLVKKEEERVKKDLEKQKKEEEKQKKEEDKQKREEDKQKKEEEKLKREEMKRLAEEEEIEKKQKLKDKFAQFFVPKKAETSICQAPVTDEVASSGPFMMFTVKGNMKLAPLVRRDFSKNVKESFDKLFIENKSSRTYLDDLKEPTYVKRKNSRTLPVQEKEVYDCEIIDEDCIDDVNNGVSGSECTKHTAKAKLLLFCENRRPAYYGTWSKLPKKVTGRTPFAKEKELFDYDYDSDDDWEEEESGESLSDSEGEEEDDQGENNYEEDNVFFVPHGYLSDDEGQDDELEDISKDEEKDGNVQKELLKKKQEEFEIEMKQKTKPLKPKVYGCVWLHDETSHQAYNQLLKIFTNYKAVNILGGELPIGTTAGGDNVPRDAKDLKANDDDAEATSLKKCNKIFPEAAVPDLIRLLHGNRHGKVFLVEEFYEYMKKQNNQEDSTLSNATPSREIIPKRRILQKIRSLGEYIKVSENGNSFKYKRWTVPKDTREKYELGDLSLENSWSYNLTPKEFPPEQKEEDNTEEPTKPKVNISLITKFTKVLTEHEKAEKMKQPSPSIDNKVATPIDSKADKPTDGKANKQAGGKVRSEVKTPASQLASKCAKPRSLPKTKSASRNIQKFFAKAPAPKADVECIDLH